MRINSNSFNAISLQNIYFNGFDTGFYQTFDIHTEKGGGELTLELETKN